MIATMLLSIVLGCTVSGPDAFLEPARAWCQSEVFSHVGVLAPEKRPKFFQIDLTLNADGFKHFSDNSTKFMMHFSGVVERMAKTGVRAEIKFLFGGQMIGHCFPNFQKLVTSCREGHDDSLDV